MIRLLFIIFLLSTQLASAQETLREVTFSVYGQYPIRNVAYLPLAPSVVETGAEAEPSITLTSHNLSRTGPYNYIGDDPIVFFEEGRPENPVAKVRVPSGSNEWLLIFVKNPKYAKDSQNQLKFLVYPFNDSKSHLPNNSLIFLNISGKELAGLVEGQRVKIGMGESNSRSAQESMPVNLWSRGFNSKELLPALIKTYQFDQNHRYLMIFFPPVLRGSTDLDVRLLGQRSNSPDSDTRNSDL